MSEHSGNALGRRNVMRGMAWSVPAVVIAGQLPAIAASSSCIPLIRFSGGTAADWGNASRPNSTQQIAFGGQVYVDNLPTGVTVTKVTEQYFVENPSSQTSTGNGYWFMGNSLSNWNKAGTCTAVGCSVQWTKPLGKATTTDYTTAPGTGWSSTVTNTVNGQATVFTDGVTRNAWDATITWTPEKGSGITAGTRGCNNFTTGPSGKFGVNYINAPSKATGSTVSLFAIVTITLNTGQILTYRAETSTLVAKPV